MQVPNRTTLGNIVMITRSNTPIFIISRNRLEYLRQLIDWLEENSMDNIHILDNDSTFEPLIDYLNHSSHNVHRFNKNYGHLALWESNQFCDILSRQNYILTDPDVLPVKECPADWLNVFYDLLKYYSNISKVGFSLKLDDIPDHYPLKETVCEWEQQFWHNGIDVGKFKAYPNRIDTTFALYRPGIYPNSSQWEEGIRTGSPYTARHLSWYIDPQNMSEDEIFYRNTLSQKHSFWSLGRSNQQIRKKLQMSMANSKEKVHSEQTSRKHI